ncbi:MAG: histidine phosphatase family protein [Thermoleophilaceae bacterium]|nr:histidine phosphatase family protein [Thermoleophilaceae bacterium]
MAVIYLLRHGQASFGTGEYDRLSELGKQQAELTGRALARRLDTIDLLAHGEMERQRDTATILAAKFGDTAPPQVLTGLNEFDHEEIVFRLKPAYRNKAVMMADLARTLQPRAAFQKIFEQALTRWISGEYDEYTEPYAAFSDRSFAAFETAAEGLTGNAVLSSSSGAISAITARLLGLGPDGWQELNRVMVNGGLTKVVIGKRGYSLVTINEHAHLEAAGSEFLTYR